jgi:hypothetical protein
VTRAAADWLLILIGVVVFATCLPFRVSSDGDQRFRDLRQVIEQGTLSPEPYSLIGPAFSTPLYLLGRLTRSARYWAARYNFVLFVGGLAVVYRLLARRVDANLARTVLLLLLAASMFPHHVRDFFGEAFSAVLATVGVLAVTLAGAAWGWVALVAATGNMPSMIVGLALVTLENIWRRRRLRYGLVVIAALGLVMAENWLRRGSPLTSGYEQAQGFPTVLPYSGRPGFSYPFLFGGLSILFSFGKGLVLFAPGLLLPVRGPLARAHRWLLLIVVGLILVYARWWAWYGGWVWGPRFFLIASVPAALAIAVHLREPDARLRVNLFVLAVLVWSTWVAANGVVFEQYGLDQCFDQNRYQWEFLCWYVPEFSALFRPLVMPKPLSASDLVLLSYFATAAAWLAVPLVRAMVPQAQRRVAAARLDIAQGARWRW